MVSDINLATTQAAITSSRDYLPSFLQNMSQQANSETCLKGGAVAEPQQAKFAGLDLSQINLSGLGVVQASASAAQTNKISEVKLASINSGFGGIG